MIVEKITLEKVTLDESDIVQAVLLLMRGKGYQIKKEDIVLTPNIITAICTIQNVEQKS